MPEGIPTSWDKGRAVEDAERDLLRCPHCGARSRPHVLWFDECYDEERFRFESSIRVAGSADLREGTDVSVSQSISNSSMAAALP